MLFTKGSLFFRIHSEKQPLNTHRAYLGNLDRFINTAMHTQGKAAGQAPQRAQEAVTEQNFGFTCAGGGGGGGQQPPPEQSHGEQPAGSHQSSGSQRWCSQRSSRAGQGLRRHSRVQRLQHHPGARRFLTDSEPASLCLPGLINHFPRGILFWGWPNCGFI